MQYAGEEGGKRTCHINGKLLIFTSTNSNPSNRSRPRMLGGKSVSSRDRIVRGETSSENRPLIAAAGCRRVLSAPAITRFINLQSRTLYVSFLCAPHNSPTRWGYYRHSRSSEWTIIPASHSSAVKTHRFGSLVVWHRRRKSPVGTMESQLLSL